MARNQEEALPYRMMQETGKLATMAGNQIYDAATASTNIGKQAIAGVGQGASQFAQDVARPFMSRASHSEAFNPAAIPAPVAAIAPQSVAAIAPQSVASKKPAKKQAAINTGNTMAVQGGTIGGSGMTPDKATRIQQSLAKGRQVPGFSMDNYIASSRSDTNGKIMEALHRGDIDTNRASALMNRDFRAADRFDRLGGNAEAYRQPSAMPETVGEGIQFGADINNFNENNTIAPRQAAINQKQFNDGLQELIKGQSVSKYDATRENTYNEFGVPTGQTTRIFNNQTGEPKDSQVDNRAEQKKRLAQIAELGQTDPASAMTLFNKWRAKFE